MNKRHIFSIVGIAIIVIIVLALVLPGKDAEEKAARKAEKSRDAEATEEMSVFTSPQTIEEGEFVYSFSGIQWDFDLIEAGSARLPETKAGFYFKEFSRRASGVLASFERPFGIGFYKGECTALDTLTSSEEMTDIEGSVVAAAICAWETEASMILVSQEGTTVRIYDKQPDEDAQIVRVIDITTIVE